MDLFSDENVNLEKSLNNLNNLVNSKITDAYINSTKTEKPQNLIIEIEGKKVVNTLKRKDAEISDFGNKITGAKKHNFALGLNVSDLKSFTQPEKEKFLVRDNIVKIDAKSLIEKGVPVDVALASEVIFKQIPKKPNFGMSFWNKDKESMDLMYEKYVSILNEVKNYIEKSTDLKELSKINSHLYDKYNARIANVNCLYNFMSDISDSGFKHKNEVDGYKQAVESAIDKFNSRDKKNEFINKIVDYSNSVKDKHNSLRSFELDIANEFNFNIMGFVSKKNARTLMNISVSNVDMDVIQTKISLGYPNIKDEDLWKTKYKVVPVQSKIGDGFVIKDLEDPYSRKVIYKTFEEAENSAKSKFYPDTDKALKPKSLKKEYNEPEKREIPALTPANQTFTEDQLIKDFNLWGGEFGNYQNNRQIILDNTYIAFSQLAKVMNVEKEFISGGGILAIAFGARGASSALAHYEPSQNVINLTKNGGAGSLAHEFGHALDHYLGESSSKENKSFISQNGGYLSDFNIRNIKDFKTPIASTMIDLIHTIKYNGEDENGVSKRTEYLKDALYYDSGRGKPYWSSNRELFARAFETYVSDKLIEMNEKCPFLVCGITNNVDDNLETRSHSAYPQGEDRVRIFKVMDKLLDEVSKNQDIILEPLKAEKEKRIEKIQTKEVTKDIEIQ